MNRRTAITAMIAAPFAGLAKPQRAAIGCDVSAGTSAGTLTTVANPMATRDLSAQDIIRIIEKRRLDAMTESYERMFAAPQDIPAGIPFWTA